MQQCQHASCNTMVGQGMFCSEHATAHPEEVLVAKKQSFAKTVASMAKDALASMKTSAPNIAESIQRTHAEMEAAGIVIVHEEDTVMAEEPKKEDTIMSKASKATEQVKATTAQVKAAVSDKLSTESLKSAGSSVWSFVKKTASRVWGFIRDNGFTAGASAVAVVSGAIVGGGFITSALVAVGAYMLMQVTKGLVLRDDLDVDFFTDHLGDAIMFPVLLGMVLPTLTVYGFAAIFAVLA